MSRSEEFSRALPPVVDPRYAITDEDRRIASGDLGGAKVRKPRTKAQHFDHLADHHGMEHDGFDTMVHGEPTLATLRNQHEESHQSISFPPGHTHG